MKYHYEFCPHHSPTLTFSGTAGVEYVFIPRLCTGCKFVMEQQNERYSNEHRHELWLELM